MSKFIVIRKFPYDDHPAQLGKVYKVHEMRKNAITHEFGNLIADVGMAAVIPDSCCEEVKPLRIVERNCAQLTDRFRRRHERSGVYSRAVKILQKHVRAKEFKGKA